MTRPYTMMHRTDRRQQLWEVAAGLRKFTYEDLQAVTGTKLSTMRGIVSAWVATGRVRRLEPEGNKAAFEVTASASPSASEPTIEGNLWQAMRGLKSFTPVDLAAHATTPEVGVSVANAQQYCRVLARGGYLRVERKAVPGRREAIYRLLRNTGPKPPRERRVWALYDENLGHFSAIAADVSKVLS